MNLIYQSILGVLRDYFGLFVILGEQLRSPMDSGSKAILFLFIINISRSLNTPIDSGRVSNVLPSISNIRNECNWRMTSGKAFNFNLQRCSSTTFPSSEIYPRSSLLKVVKAGIVLLIKALSYSMISRSGLVF